METFMIGAMMLNAACKGVTHQVSPLLSKNVAANTKYFIFCMLIILQSYKTLYYRIARYCQHGRSLVV